MAGIYTTVARGTVTQANMKISAVDGTAFVDFGAANVLTSKLGHLLKIRDSSGRAIQGFIDAAGTGETLSETDLAAGWDFTSGWSPGSVGASIVDTNTFTTIYGAGIYKNLGLGAGRLYQFIIAGTVSAGFFRLLDFDAAVSILNGFGTNYVVWKVTNKQVYFYNSLAATTDITTFQCKQVLTPSSTGVTIVNTKGGSTFNFALKNSAFNYNDSSGYTYEIIQVRQAVLMDSDACLNANATINLTDGSATWACAGIDDSAFQDGKHMITVSDATGKTVLGYYENAGSGDVVNTKAGSTNNWIWKDASFSTAGDYTRKIYYVGD